MQHRNVIKEAPTYTRADFTALRAYALRIPISTIENLYYTRNCPQVQEGLERFLIDMKNELIERAMLTNPKAAESLKQIRAGGMITDRALKIIFQLAQAKVTEPKASDVLGIWFRPRIAHALSYTAQSTVGDLVTYINRHGPGWWRPIPRLGVIRAKAVTSFLSRHPATGELSLEALGSAQTAVTPTSAAARRLPVSASSMSLGANRGKEFCLIAARNDFEAAEAFLEMVSDNKITFEAYSKEIGRFLLWTSQIINKPIGALLGEDIAQFKSFLSNPPSHWIGPKVHRSSPRWRPFTGPLSTSSQRYAWYTTRRFLAWLVSVHYLSANPFEASKAPVDNTLKPQYPDKALSSTHWPALILSSEARAAQSQKPHHRLMHAALLLIGDSGLRRSEAASAERQNLRSITDLRWMLSILGKGNKWRDVVVSQRTIQALRDHWKDRQIDFEKAPEGTPLLSPVIRIKTSASKNRADNAGYLPIDLGRALGRYCRQIALNPDSDLDVEARNKILQATTHTLRHTFATQAIHKGVPIDVVQMMLGHANLSTTSVYITAERDRMLDEMGRFHHSFVQNATINATQK